MILDASRLHFAYNGADLLHAIDFQVRPGELVAAVVELVGLGRPGLGQAHDPGPPVVRIRLDEDDRVRIIVVAGKGEHFSSGGNIKGFLEASPEHVSHLGSGPIDLN